MRHLSPIVAAVALLMNVGCVRTATNEATGGVDLDIESPTKQGEDWHGRVLGKGSWTGLAGDVQALVVEGNTAVTVSVSGATPGSAVPWHIHEGTCETGGEIIGDHNAYMPLVIGSDGRGTGNAQISVALDEAKDYFVSMHASATDMATIVACGDLDD